jgi:hypothetical protein
MIEAEGGIGGGWGNAGREAHGPGPKEDATFPPCVAPRRGRIPFESRGITPCDVSGGSPCRIAPAFSFA